MALSFDYIEPAALTGYVREVPTPANYILNRFLPDVFVGDIDVAWDVATQTNRAAKFRSYDAETPIGKSDSFSRSRLTLPPLGQKTLVSEFERLRLEQVRSGGDTRNRLVEAIYDQAAINTRAVLARLELARGDVLTDGKFSLVGENGLTLEADFGIDSSHIVAPTTVWSNHSASDPIGDSLGWNQTYTDDAGEPPGWALTSRTVMSDILQNEKVRAMAGTLAGTPTIVTRAQLDTITDAYELPRFVTYDTLIDVDGSSTRPIPVDRVVYLPRDPSSLGKTYWGVTAEALELAGGTNPQITFQQAPGLTGVVMKSFDPVQIWTKVGAIALPVITDSRRIMIADVR